MIAVIGLVIGVVLGLVLQPSVPAELQPYLPIAVVAALTVTVAMRVVGLLLVSALMIVPVAVSQLLSRSFGTTMGLAMGLGAAVCVVGLSVTYWVPLAPGATIVVLAIAVYLVVLLGRGLVPRR